MSDFGKFKKDIYYLLKNTAAFADLIGTAAAFRMYATKAPQAATDPYAVYRVIDTGDSLTHSGVVGWDHTRLEFSLYGKNSSVCSTLFDALKEIMLPVAGLTGPIGINGTEIGFCVNEGYQEGTDPPSKLSWIKVDFRLSHNNLT